MQTISDIPDINDVDVNETHDTDLVQLAGYHAYRYREYDEGDLKKVNGKEFEVIETKYEADTGLDALTIKNVETDELSVVFVGSQQLKEDWATTNTQLLSDLEPAQITAAKAYYDHVEDTYGNVSSVAGNSLAGALANAVAVEHSDVRSVTLNPAMLPAGTFDPDRAYAHITNYYSKYDFLTSTQDTLGLGDRIPGNKYHINNGLPAFDMLGSNHTGYVDRMDNDFKVPIGVKGEPGYGFIHVGADDHIVTSIWTGAPLYGGSSTKLKINKSRMTTLAEGLENQVIDRVKLADGYVGNAREIVQHEREQFNQRVTELQERFKTMLNELAGDPTFNGIANTGAIIKACIDELISLLNFAEGKCRSLNSILNSKPMELVEYVTSVDISVESIFAPARNNLNDIKTDIDQLVSKIQTIIVKDIPDLFKGGTDAYVDAVTGELNDHYSVVYHNVDRLLGQMLDYKIQVQDIADAFHNKDSSLAGAISSNTSVTAGTDTVKKTAVFTVESSPYLKNRMKIKELQVDLAFEQLKNIAMIGINTILIAVEGVLVLLEGALTSILYAIDSALNVALYGNPAGWAISLFTDYDEKIKAAVHEAKKPIEEMESTVEGLRKGFARMIANLPEMLDNFKSYVDTAIFEPGNFANVRLYNIAASAILDEMELLFKDITFQLSGEEAEAIQASLEVAESIQGNIKILNEQVERGTI